MEHLLDFLPKQRTQMIKTQLLFACGSLSRHINAQVVTHRVTGCKRRTYRGPHESTEASSTLVLPKTEPGSRSFEMCQPRGQVWGRKGSWGRKKKKKKRNRRQCRPTLARAAQWPSQSHHGLRLAEQWTPKASTSYPPGLWKCCLTKQKQSYKCA